MNPKINKFTVTLFCLFFGFQISGYSQYSWYQMENFKGTARYGAVSFTTDTAVYVGLGRTSTGYVKDFWRYSPAKDTWFKVADFGGPARMYAVAFTLNNKGYVVTGEDASARYKDLWEYDPATNQWTKKADFGGTARSRAVSFAINNKGYVATGYDGADKKDLWEYDPTANTWTAKADLTSDPRESAVGFSLNGIGYICAGVDYTSGTMMTNDVYAYNPATNTWTEKSFAESHLARTFSTAFVLNNKAYVCGGLGKKDLWEYNPTSNAWTKRADFGLSTEDNRYGAVSFAINGRGYVATGQYMVDFSNTQIKNDVWTYSLPLPPKTPTNLWAFYISSNAIALEWVYSSNDDPSFIIERSTNNNSNFVKIDSVKPYISNGYRHYSNFNLTDTTLYYYRIRTVTNAGYSAYTNELAVSTRFDNPISLIAAPISKKQIDLLWQCNSTHGEKFFIEKSVGDNSHFSIMDSVALGTTMYSDTSVIAGTKYFYRIFLKYKDIKRYTNMNAAIPDEQGSWRRLTQTPDYAEYAYSFIIEKKYYLGYTNRTANNEFYVYDMENKQWTKKSSYPGKALYGWSAFSLNGKGYVGLGRDSQSASSNKFNDFWEYDPEKDSWTRKADFPGMARYNASAVTIGTKGYIGLGLDDINKYRDIWEYDPVANNWVQKADAPVAFSYNRMSVSLNNLAYFGLGDTTAIFYAYDPASNTWAKKNYFSELHSEMKTYAQALAFVAQGRIFVISSKRNSFWEYNPTTDVWKRRNGYSHSVWPSGESCVISNGLFGFFHPAGEMTKNGGSSSRSLYIYDPVAPTAPTDLKVTDYSSTRIALKWKDNTDIETKYVIERTSYLYGNWSRIDSVAANQITYTDTTITKDAIYYYRVYAATETSSSGCTNEVSAKSGTPNKNSFESITSKYNLNKVYINYYNPYEEDFADGYILERSDAKNPANFTTLGTFPSNVRSFVDSSVVVGEWYTYRLKAFNKLGSTDIKPVRIKAGSICMTEGTMKVDKATFFDDMGYDLEYSHTSQKVMTMLPIDFTKKLTADFKELFIYKTDTLFVYDGTSTMSPLIGKYTGKVLPNLICANNADGALTFRLKSGFSWSNDGQNTGWMIEINSHHIFPPSNLKTVAELQNISLKWQDNSADEDYFIIERSVNDNQHYVKIDSTYTNVNAYTDKTAVSAEQYYYRVKTKRDAAYSTYSNQVSTMLLPLAPSDLDVKLDSTFASVSWKDNSDNEQGFIVEYFYYSWKADTIVANVTSRKYPVDFEKKYYFRAKAFNVGGSSSYSNKDSIMLLKAPNDLEVYWNTNSINLTWLDNANNELFYVIERSVMDSLHFTILDSVATNVLIYKDITLSSNTKYYYRVKAVSNMGESLHSNMAKYTIGVLQGVDDVEENPELSVYPNPTRDKVKLKLCKTIIPADIISINLFDISGAKVRTIHKSDQNQDEIEIDLSAFSAGIYYLQINTHRGVIIRSVVKQ